MNGSTLTRPWLQFLPAGTDAILRLTESARDEGTAESLAVLREVTADYEEAVQETAGMIAAKEPLAFCGMTCPSVPVAVLRLSLRAILVAEASVAGLDTETDEAKARLVAACLERLLQDLDADWLKAELALELRDVRSEPDADGGLSTWLPDPVDEFMAVRERLPEGWIEWDREKRLAWISKSSETETENEPRHAPGYTSVNWHGTLHEFSPMQSRCVELLWSTWKNSTPTVHETFLQSELDTDTRIRDLFKGHPAWGSMIVSGGPKGTFRLSHGENL